jgi:putative endonuclease
MVQFPEARFRGWASMFTVYVIKSLVDGRCYTGQTANLKARLARHVKGDVRSTSYRGPFELVYQEKCANRAEALKRERYLKSGPGKRFLKSKV